MDTPIWRIVAMAAVLGAPLPVAAQAPDTAQVGGGQAGVQPRPEMWRNAATKCAAETERFCPADVGRTPREKTLCLKYYKTSLSLGCRGAINALAR